MKRGTVIRALALMAALAPAANAAAAPQPPFGRAGGFVTDAQGRVFVSHGVNMVYKLPPYEPATPGFGEDDAAFLEHEGFNSVRLGVIYKAVEPQPGVYSDAYLASIAQTASILEQHGITPLIDFHQDMYNERYQGEGWPDWAALDNGLPAQPQLGFPYNYLVQPALNRAFDNFWANAPGPGGAGIGDRYAQAWMHVARRFADDPGILGYDLMNEPWPGTTWALCANPIGCPLFDRGVFAAFYRRTLKALRAADRAHLAWYEPNVIFNDGADTQLPDFRDRRVAMSWHNYCLFGALGSASAPICDIQELLPFQNAQKRTKVTGDPGLMTEFGATSDLAMIHRIVQRADEFRMGWQWWAYCGCEDPTTSGPGETQAIVKNASKPPTGDNVIPEKLAILVRPYPQVVAGTPKLWNFKPDTKEFVFQYSTARAGGGSFAGAPLTDVYVPQRQYPSGYAVRAKGAAIVSSPGAQTLQLQACPGATSVTVTVTTSGASSGDCVATRRKARARARRG